MEIPFHIQVLYDSVGHPPPAQALIIIDQSEFARVPSGKNILSFYDRKEDAVYLRRESSRQIEHELYHQFLDHRFGELSYRESEKLVEILQFAHDYSHQLRWYSAAEMGPQSLFSIFFQLPEACKGKAFKNISLNMRETMAQLDCVELRNGLNLIQHGSVKKLE